MSRWYRYVCIAIGSCFLGIGLMTFSGVLLAWHVGKVILWQGLAYAGLDIVLAEGFFTFSDWLLTALTLNSLGLALLLGIRTLHSHHANWIGLALSALLWIFVYLGRRKGYPTEKHRLVYIFFLLLWTPVLCYTINSVF